MHDFASSVEQPFRIAPVDRGNGVRATIDRLPGKVVLSPDTPSAVVEQYRRLAATLHHAQRDRQAKVLMISSAMPGEGKTLTATNLALTLTESFRRRVLVIDADLRRPSMHHTFGLPNNTGLNDALLGRDNMPTAFEMSSRLTVLPAGCPNPDPIGVLTSPAMRQLVKFARDGYDWVLIDTPPVGLLTDAHLVAQMVDAVVMVVSAGAVPYRVVQRSADALGRDRIIGVVLNRAAAAPFERAYGYGGYGGYYGAHSHEDQEQA
ncbi:MAG: capsular biosynthesis protein [Acidobacteria bacterium]|nr:MAG: capsular biosynthesis protein [Acidobacteriota bacterium]